jgi:hypothetical protein
MRVHGMSRAVLGQSTCRLHAERARLVRAAHPHARHRSAPGSAAGRRLVARGRAGGVVRACVAGSDETEADAQDVWDRAQLLSRYVLRCGARCLEGRVSGSGRSPMLWAGVQVVLVRGALLGVSARAAPSSSGAGPPLQGLWGFYATWARARCASGLPMSQRTGCVSHNECASPRRMTHRHPSPRCRGTVRSEGGHCC